MSLVSSLKDYLETGRQEIDGFLEQLEEAQNVQSSLLNIFPTDHQCLQRMGQRLHRTRYMCNHCHDANLMLGIQDTDSVIERANIKVILKSTRHVSIQIIDQTLSQWCHHVITNWTVYRIFRELALPHVSVLARAFVCNNVGYTLSNYHEYQDLKLLLQTGNSQTENSKTENSKTRIIAKRNIKELILQLAVIYDSLRACKYSETQVNSFVWTSEPCNYNYKDYNIDSNFTVYLVKYTSASFSLKNKRFLSSTHKDSENSFGILLENLFNYLELENTIRQPYKNLKRAILVLEKFA